MGATITTEKIANAVKDDVSAYSTYGWHPLSVDAAIANLKYIKRHKKRLLRNVEELSDYFMARLSQMEFKHPVTVRIKGLAIGINLGGLNVGDSEYAWKVSDKCRRAGLLVTSEDEALTMFPALNIDQKVAREGLDILEQCLSCENLCPDPALHRTKAQPRQPGRYRSEFRWSYLRYPR